jgi:hypothetical protein
MSKIVLVILICISQEPIDLMFFKRSVNKTSIPFGYLLICFMRDHDLIPLLSLIPRS